MLHVKVTVNIVLDRNNVLNAVRDSGFKEHLKVQQVLVKPVILLAKLVMVDQLFVHLALMNTDCKAHIVFLFTTSASLLSSI